MNKINELLKGSIPADLLRQVNEELEKSEQKYQDQLDWMHRRAIEAEREVKLLKQPPDTTRGVSNEY